MKRNLQLIAAIYFLLSTISSAQSVVWIEAAPGVWKCVIGSPEKIDLYSSAEIKPDLAGLMKIDPDDFPLPQKDISAEVADSKTYLRFPLVKGEQIYGFGLNFKTVHQRGKILQLHVDHYRGTDNGRTHAPVPVFVKDGGIIPMMPPMLHAPAAGQKFDLEIRYYGTKPGFYLLYDDDGETFDYEKGILSWREIKVTADKKGKLKGTILKAEKGKPDNIGNVTWRFMTQ